MVASTSEEQLHVLAILNKCRNENDPHRLVDHLQAIKTYYLAFSIQQNTLMFQLKEGQIIEGALEDRLMNECAGCVGETQQVVKELHHFLRKYEDNPEQDAMGFRVAANRLIHHFDHSLNRITTLADTLAERMAVT